MMGGIGDTGWDGNGDFAAHGPDVFHLWLTDEDVTDETVVSSVAFGQLAVPNACPQPGGSEQTGYEIPGGAAKAVARWHFAYHA
jgi:hypothetical protein